MTTCVLKNWGIMFSEMFAYILCFIRLTWNNTKQVAHVFTSVGWVSKTFGTCWIHFSQNNL
jgi:hypothetical protein